MILKAAKNLPALLREAASNIMVTISALTAQKMRFSIKDFFSKCDQSRRKLRIWSDLLKKSLMEHFIFWTVLTLSINSEQNVNWNCKNHKYCNMKLHEAYNKLLKFNREQTYMKILFIIYEEVEPLLQQSHACDNVHIVLTKLLTLKINHVFIKAVNKIDLSVIRVL